MAKYSQRISKNFTFLDSTLDIIFKRAEKFGTSKSVALEQIVHQWNSLDDNDFTEAINNVEQTSSFEKRLAELEQTTKKLVDVNERMLLHLRLLNSTDKQKSNT